jgi:hypothetical protein
MQHTVDQHGNRLFPAVLCCFFPVLLLQTKAEESYPSTISLLLPLDHHLATTGLQKESEYLTNPQRHGPISFEPEAYAGAAGLVSSDMLQYCSPSYHLGLKIWFSTVEPILHLLPAPSLYQEAQE